MKSLAVLVLALVAALAPEAHATVSKGTLVVNVVGIPKGHVRSVLISDGRYPKPTRFTKKGGGSKFVFKNVPPRVYEVFADLSFRFAKADARYRRGDVALRVNDRNAPNVTGGRTATYTLRYRRVSTPKRCFSAWPGWRSRSPRPWPASGLACSSRAGSPSC